MRAALSLVLVLVLVAETKGEDPQVSAPADFKVHIEFFGPRKEPLRRADLLARKGRAYWVLSDSNEVIVYEPADQQVEMLDLERMERSDLSLKKVDDALARWLQARMAAIEKLENAGGRANVLAAGMSRDLIDPRFQVAFDQAAQRLRLTNTSVDVDAVGEAEPEPARRTLETDALAWFLKLETIREPRALPPFPALTALSGLAGKQSLRPREITFTYRLAGPPHKVRWTYTLEPALSAREVATIARIDLARGNAKFLRFDRYEREEVKPRQDQESKRSPAGP